jgi:hypothetical protein
VDGQGEAGLGQARQGVARQGKPGHGTAGQGMVWTTTGENMKTVRVSKADLIATVTVNRDQHRETFIAAQEKFRERVIEQLDARLAEARQGKHVDLAIRLPEPVDYTDEYQRALDMLDWEIDDEVELDQQTFAQLVRNEWSWARMFASNTEAYTSGALA